MLQKAERTFAIIAIPISIDKLKYSRFAKTVKNPYCARIALGNKGLVKVDSFASSAMKTNRQKNGHQEIKK